MTWYLIILIIVMAISFASEKKTIAYTKYEQEYISCGISNIGFISIIIILILFEGLRSSTVGTDTGGYCRGFMHGTSDWWKLNFSNIDVLLQEPGLTLIYYISELFSNNYISFLLVASAIMVVCSLTGIRSCSINFKASLFAYITLAFYLFGFAGIRQGVAISIFILAYKYIFSGNLSKYIAVVLIATLFHKSILIALPVFIVTKLKFSFKNLCIIAVIAVVIGLSMSTLLNYGSRFEERYEYYLQSTAAGSGSLLTIFSACLTVFYISQRNRIDATRLTYYDKSLIMLLISSAIYLVVTITESNTELNRFAFYFQTGAIFLLAEYVKACRQSGNVQIMRCVIIVHIIYYIAYVNFIGGISDYKLNPVVQSLFYEI